ncbi:hypothetical protein [Paenibacillus sp. KS1]|uniref:hypothetical protein n=1 Tax=Paenibacillus sp. KS1 TaxID=1849249 RepID=UPI001C3098C1|nr:hypothetical protein [Paenibacillus sp. KS1]
MSVQTHHHIDEQTLQICCNIHCSTPYSDDARAASSEVLKFQTELWPIRPSMSRFPWMK